MMLSRIERSDWRSFCDRISVGLPGKRAEIEVASLNLGVQLEAEWSPVIGVVYDPSKDILEIFLDGLDHMIFHPCELYAGYGPGGLDSLGVLDCDRAWQIVLLRDPLMLPAPHPTER